MRAVALHPDVLVATSAIWQTNCAIVRDGDEAFLVDALVLPDELDAIPSLVAQAHFPSPSGMLATHGDWDHLLGRLAFPEVALGCAESTVQRMQDAPGEAQRELRGFDQEHLIERARPLALGALQALPVPGRCEIGGRELELHPATGHGHDGMAVWVPWARVLLAGDYLSAVELPSFGAAADTGEDAPDAYRQTLERLRPLIREAAHVVPGHGPVLDSDGAAAVLEEDLAYLTGLSAHGVHAELPPSRRGPVQRARHLENVGSLEGGG